MGEKKTEERKRASTYAYTHGRSNYALALDNSHDPTANCLRKTPLYYKAQKTDNNIA